MRRHLHLLWFLGISAAALWSSGIIPAIVPQAVPTANKIGNSTKFQLGASGAVAGDCPTFDASLNITGPGTGLACGASANAGGGLTVYSGLAGVGLSGTLFFPIGGGSQASSTETNVDADISASTTISRMGANLSTSLGGTNSVVFTWRKNGADTALTCTVTAPATSCADTVNSFAVVPGDLVAIKAVFTGTIVVAPVFVLTAQAGSLVQGQVNVGTAGQFGYYASNGATLSGGNLSGDVTANSSLAVTVAKVNAVAYAASPSTNTVPVVTASNVATYKALPNCTDTGGNHLNYNTSTFTWSCGTTSSGTTQTSIYPAFTSVIDGNYAWFNQSTASYSNTNSIIYMTVPQLAATSLNLRAAAAPVSTPWSITIAVLVTSTEGQTNAGGGLMVYDSVGGHYESVQLDNTNGATLTAHCLSGTSLTNATGQSTNNVFGSGLQFLKVLDNGTNLIFSVSADGVSFTQACTRPVSGFANTPDKTGFYVTSFNAAQSTSMAILSWIQGTT